MKLIYDALLRAAVATILSEVASVPFIKLANPTLSTEVFDALIFAIPVFIAMLGYNIIKARLGKQVPEGSK